MDSMGAINQRHSALAVLHSYCILFDVICQEAVFRRASYPRFRPVAFRTKRSNLFAENPTKYTPKITNRKTTLQIAANK
jgi:hypothetical protein